MIRSLKHFILFVIIILVSSAKVSAQALDNPVFSLKNEKLKSLIEKELYNNVDSLHQYWYCIDNKEKYINQLLKKSKNNETYEYLQLLKAFYLNESYRINESLKIANEIANKPTVIWPGKLYYLFARIYGQKQNIAEAIEYYLKAIDALKSTDELAMIHAKIHLINKYFIIGDFDTASENYSEALLLCEKNNDTLGFLRLYISYAEEIEKYDASYSRELFQKGREFSRNYHSVWKTIFNVEYLRFLLTNGDKRTFDELLNETKAELENSCLYLEHSIVYTFLAHTHSRVNNYDSAIYYNKKALSLRLKSGNNYFSGYSYLNLYNNYIHKNQISMAESMLDSAKVYLFENGNLESKRYYLSSLLQYYKKLNLQDSLVSTFNTLIALNEDYFKEQQLILSNNLNIKNELNIKLEKEKFNLELDKNKNRLLYISLISALSIIIIIILIYVIRTRTNRFNQMIYSSNLEKQSLIKYKQELNELKEIFKNAEKGFLIIDKEFKIQYYNASAQKIIYFNQDELQGSSISSVFPEEYSDLISNTIKKIKIDKRNIDYVITLENEIKRRLILNLSLSPLTVNNTVESILMIITDVTESTIALENEKQQRKILQTLFNSVTESIVLIDKSGTVELINETAASRMGCSVEDAIGKDYLGLVHDVLKEGRKEKLNYVLSSKQAIVFNEEVDSFNSMISYYPNINMNGEVEFIAEFSQDITERKLALEEINSLRQRILRSQMNPHFIFNSLNAIQSYMLKNDAKEAVKYLNSFAKLIRMILDSSRYDYISLAKEIDILKYYIELQSLRFGDKFESIINVDEKLYTDSILIPAMLAQPFIENSIEHGLQQLEEKGMVEISFKKHKDRIIFTVLDNGIGREASQKIKENLQHQSSSLSTQLFKERLYALNKYSGQKITYEIIDLKNDDGKATGTKVEINLPMIFKSDMMLN